MSDETDLTEFNVPSETKKTIIKRQIQLWKNTLYEAQVQARVAQVIRNEEMQTAAAARAEEAIRAMDELGLILIDLGPNAAEPG